MEYLCQGISYAAAAGAVYVGTSFLRAISNEEHTHDSRFGKRTPARLPAGPNYFINKDGLQIFWRCWFPKSNKPKGIVVLCHGLAEHSGRYEAFASFLTGAGYAVYALDHQGHGASEGDRIHVKKFDDFKLDVLQFTTMVKGRHPKLSNRFFLIGHSMGGLISIHVALANLGQWKGVVLSGVPIKPDPKVASAFTISVAHFLSKMLPKMGIDNLPAEPLCSDKTVVQNYVNDPLCYCGKIKARIGSEMLIAMEKARNNAASFKVPFLLLHGENDETCLPSAASEFVELAPSEYSEHVFYKGMRHEIFNEPDKKPVQDVVEWLEKNT